MNHHRLCIPLDLLFQYSPKKKKPSPEQRTERKAEVNRVYGKAQTPLLLDSEAGCL